MKSLKYRRMIAGLETLEKNRKKTRPGEAWYLYMLRCSDGSLYTGITNNVQRRVASHQSGKGARFTRSHLPVELVYQESCSSRSSALIREFRVKALPRKKKEALVSTKDASIKAKDKKTKSRSK